MIHRTISIAAISAVLLSLYCACGREPSTHREWLETAWRDYRRDYIHPQGYVLDRTRNDGEVTSEGQGYALLRAVWMRDRETFGRVFEWTRRNLRRSDGLHSWLWSPVNGGEIRDLNSATDADQEIAFALLLASRAFQEPGYLSQAREILQAIRLHSRIPLPAGWFPAAGNWAVADRIVNLSYFVPYAYPYFERADPQGGWSGVREAGYDLIRRVLDSPGVLLPPDFMGVRADGEIDRLAGDNAVSGDFSFDAMRIYWRVALDCRMHRSLRACADPCKTSNILGLLSRDGAMFTRYQTDGSALTGDESLSFYGSLVFALRLHAPAASDAVLSGRLGVERLRPLLDAQDRYFDLNWVWFGLAADLGLIEKRTPTVEQTVP
ncbi:MAG: hypothetical protein FJW35_04180 [Acidobacteria bacterium]|nr:hypothetical protein [Acidobacteriota bacterium]